MKRFVFLMLSSSLAVVGTAQIIPTEGLREMITNGSRATGLNYQVAQRCGAKGDLLARYKGRFESDLKGGGPLYAQLGIDTEKLFDEGRREGDTFYSALGAAADRERVCQATLAQMQSQISK